MNIAAQLKPGERAIAVQLDRTTGLNFLAKPGDSVDIILAEEITVLQPAEDQTGGAQRFEVVNGLEKARTVKTVLQNLRVLYVSTTLATAATPAPGAIPPRMRTPNANTKRPFRTRLS